MLFKENEIQLKEYHWERLLSGLKQLYFNIPTLMNEAWLEEEVSQTVKRNKLEKLCRVRLQIYAGEGGIIGAANQKPEFIIECFPLDEKILQLNENGLVIGIADNLKKSIDSLANLKSCSALIYAIASRQANERKWNDALILNSYNNIIESTIANIFWIKDDNVYTPPLSDGCVEGVMRKHLITCFSEKGTTVTEKSISENELLNADEVFLTNAIRRIKWVKALNGKEYISHKTQIIYKTLFV